MLDHEFLDKWDMGRRIEARLFCFGSGDSDDGGSSNVDTSNPNEMLSREQDQAFFEGSRRAIVEPQGGDPAKALSAVTGISPTLVELAQSATPAQRAANAAANERQFQEFIANVENPSTTGFGPPVTVADVPTVANFVVGAANLPPSVVTGQNRENFDTTSGDIIAPLGDRYDELPPSPAELFRAQESQRAMGLDQRQAGYDAYQAMLGNAVADAQGNIDSATGLLGMPTRVMNQMFIDGMNTRIGDRNSAAYQSYLNDTRLFEPVYNQRGRLTGYRDQFGRLTGTDPIGAAAAMGEDDERRVEAEVNPMTDKPRCPDGYVFDEDLQACRLNTSTSVDQAAPPDGEIFFRRTSLDDAPANLPSGFDFDAANTRFVQSYGSRPDFYRSPMSLTGFTRL